ncbi:carboxylesterase/lipase family protein [Mycolicibacterium baixiangningiae]|uniref:carboxylesterase/lipase family protein n=1 Tax=Mycolicibacterium baixiangningiae TaxID=2761578 RepID=UPI001866C99B|nr:carboxylesterase family protein [Mycolicibacterium baixiangningiae]
MSETVVVITSGDVRGRTVDEYSVFLGIPYATPPTGAARFAEPAPHPGWTQVRDAAEPGPAAPQAPRSGFGALDMSPFFGTARLGDPEYLTLNVWAPSGAVGRPVMVFVHGGGFVSGSTRSPLYDGAAFARDGVVLVTVTYRLGIVGFLDLPGAPPNRGLLDVLAALKWVKANAESFGGDPDNVTLFGQSAGATLVGALLATPDARPLLRRAIMQSGNGTGAFDREQAARVTHRVAQLLGTDPTVDGFVGFSDDELVAVGSRLAGVDLRTRRRFDPLAGLSPFSVVMDRQPADAVAAGVGASVPLLIGTNAQEGNLYLVPQGTLETTTENDVRDLADRTHADPDTAVAKYCDRYPHATWGQIRSAMLGDALFVSGTGRLIDAHSSHAAVPLHEYRFSWRSAAVGGRLGAAHAVELPFVFDRLHEPVLRGPAGLLGPEEPPRALASAVHGAWVDYATTGDPGWAPDSVREFSG